MSKEQQEGSRVDQLYSEYHQLETYLDQAFKDKDHAKILEIQGQRKRLSAEIQAIDPTFGKEAA